ncbi:MAG TPA: tetratricopeptide repeat protein [Patescibacteria group bacterium]|nr:tetratricopeptide repeat protein [Patescibacteria group bacterium]
MANKNYRKITEALPQGPDLASFFIFIFAGSAIVLIFYLGLSFFHYVNLLDGKKRVQDNLSYWESVVEDHPNLTDGYYNAAVYAVELGNKNKAIGYLDKALELDPSFDKARELEKRITNKE